MRSILLIKYRRATFYGVAPAKPRGRELAAEFASLIHSEERGHWVQQRLAAIGRGLPPRYKAGPRGLGRVILTPGLGRFIVPKFSLYK